MPITFAEQVAFRCHPSWAPFPGLWPAIGVHG